MDSRIFTVGFLNPCIEEGRLGNLTSLGFLFNIPTNGMSYFAGDASIFLRYILSWLPSGFVVLILFIPVKLITGLSVTALSRLTRDTPIGPDDFKEERAERSGDNSCS